MLLDAEAGRFHSVSALKDASITDGHLLDIVREYASESHDEGYDRGVHDHDAVKILRELVSVRQTVGRQRFPARPRAAASLY